jgi:hypothetical protein
LFGSDNSKQALYKSIINEPFDLFKFIHNEYIPGLDMTYQQVIISYYNHNKIGVNIFDVLVNSRHFFEMFKVFGSVMDNTERFIDRVAF